ncbi:MAG: hypothetical protein AAF561_08320 [Planctomycetota bacterium]
MLRFAASFVPPTLRRAGGRWLGLVLLLAVFSAESLQAEPLPALTQADDRREAMPVTADASSARLWTEGRASVLFLRGDEDSPIRIQAGETTLEANSAVVWSRILPSGLGRRRLDVVLMGDVAWQSTLGQGAGPHYVLELIADGPVELRADDRQPGEASEDPLVVQARRRLAEAAGEPGKPSADDVDPSSVSTAISPLPTTQPQAATLPPEPLAAVQARRLRTVPASDDLLAVEATGGFFLIREEADGSLVELRADRAVVFSKVERLDDIETDDTGLSDDLARNASGVYLEGGVEVLFTDAPRRRNGRVDLPRGDQQLRARRAYYDFDTGQALLGEAVLHTSATGDGDELPLTVRAKALRRFVDGDYEARAGRISSTRFATPMLSLGASRVFIRETESFGSVRRIAGADNVTGRVFDVPLLYFPVVRGVLPDRRVPLRGVRVGESRNRGTFVRTEWGLFETIGRDPPRNVDATYEIDYFSERGVRGALRGDYGGSFFLPVGEGRPALYDGSFLLEGIDDRGDDDLPGRRPDVPQDGLRGRFEVEHALFLPSASTMSGEDFALFFRLGLLSDSTYLESWDRPRFNDGPAHDLSLLAINRSRNKLGWASFNVSLHNYPTFAEVVQENTAIERLPELGAGSFGDRLGPMTVSTEARLGVLAFDRLSGDLQRDLSLPDGIRGFPGFPSYAYTPDTERIVPRFDLRQEVAAPSTGGFLSLRPYVVGRTTAYGDGPFGGATGRVLAGAGVSVRTAFAGVSNSVYSRILSLDRLRHVVEPYADVFGSIGWGPDTTELYVFDEQVDGYGELGIVRLGLRQRIQTYRGPPGGKRSVDLFDIDVSANFFDAADGRERAARLQFEGGPDPDGLTGPFRGVFYESRPEASLPLDTLEGGAAWNITDTTSTSGRLIYGLDAEELLSAVGEVRLERGERLDFRIDARYLRPADSTTIGGSAQYRLSRRYDLFGRSVFDVDQGRLRSNSVSITRFFERATLQVGLFLDNIDDEGGIRVDFRPFDVPGLDIDSFSVSGG